MDKLQRKLGPVKPPVIIERHIKCTCKDDRSTGQRTKPASVSVKLFSEHIATTFYRFWLRLYAAQVVSWRLISALKDRAIDSRATNDIDFGNGNKNTRELGLEPASHTSVYLSVYLVQYVACRPRWNVGIVHVSMVTAVSAMSCRMRCRPDLVAGGLAEWRSTGSCWTFTTSGTLGDVDDDSSTRSSPMASAAAWIRARTDHVTQRWAPADWRTCVVSDGNSSLQQQNRHHMDVRFLKLFNNLRCILVGWEWTCIRDCVHIDCGVRRGRNSQQNWNSG